MTFGRLFYSDVLSGDAFNARRNLSFRTNILEVSGGLEFNFRIFNGQKILQILTLSLLELIYLLQSSS